VRTPETVARVEGALLYRGQPDHQVCPGVISSFGGTWVVGLLTGHCHLKGHLFKLGLTDDPICERCLEEDESATHILCDYEAVAHVRFRHMEPSDYYDAPIYKVLHFIRGVGLIKG
jgi:hypothetical protein